MANMSFTNNAATTLASGITNVATSLTVASGTGALFPALSGSQYFWCTLANNAGTVEIVKVTARSTDTFTITRAQDNTSAVSWNSGDKVELRLVAAALNDLPKLDEANTFASGVTQTIGTLALTNALTVANGGTGQTTYTNGQLLIGNTTGNTLTKATLTAGTLISITNGAGAITIAGTGPQLVSGTAVATTSGTSVTFSSIPSWVKRITVMLNSISVNSSGLPLIRIGSGSIDATGYTGTTVRLVSGGNAPANLSTGFPVADGSAASQNWIGNFVLTNLSGNIWTANGMFGGSDAARASIVAGVKTLSSTLDRIQLTTDTGTDTFDAGSVNILYEG